MDYKEKSEYVELKNKIVSSKPQKGGRKTRKSKTKRKLLLKSRKIR